jgi:hypothetical protein
MVEQRFSLMSKKVLAKPLYLQANLNDGLTHKVMVTASDQQVPLRIDDRKNFAAQTFPSLVFDCDTPSNDCLFKVGYVNGGSDDVSEGRCSRPLSSFLFFVCSRIRRTTVSRSTSLCLLCGTSSNFKQRAGIAVGNP